MSQAFTFNKILYIFASRLILAGLFLLFCPVFAKSQVRDTVRADTVIRNHSPRKAVIYSLICPGLGQAYNKKYWKIPFIYAGGGTFLYYISYNQRFYKKFIEAKKGDPDEPASIFGYTVPYSRLDAGRDAYRRYRDLCVAGLGAIYLLNVIDAMVDAHFFYYDISDDLSMRIEPTVIQSPGTIASLGFRVNLGF